MTEEEEWRPVVGWEGLYEVSSLGRVRSLDRIIVVEATHRSKEFTRRKRGQLLSSDHLVSGYPTVCLKARADDRRRDVFIHTLVCEAFHGPRPDGQEVAHNDGIRQNPRASNLRWDTRQGNLDDMVAHGTRLFGEMQPVAKLTGKEVDAIRRSPDISQNVLAKQFGVSQQTISLIQTRKGWRHLLGDGEGTSRVAKPRVDQKLSDDDVRAIRASNERGVDLAVRYGVSKSRISTVRNGKSRTKVS